MYLLILKVPQLKARIILFLQQLFFLPSAAATSTDCEKSTENYAENDDKNDEKDDEDDDSRLGPDILHPMPWIHPIQPRADTSKTTVPDKRQVACNVQFV